MLYRCSQSTELQRLGCLDLALSGPVHGASVWNDVEGQTADCGIVGAGYPLHQRGPRRQFAIRDVTPPPVLALYPVNWQDVLKVAWALGAEEANSKNIYIVIAR